MLKLSFTFSQKKLHNQENLPVLSLSPSLSLPSMERHFVIRASFNIQHSAKYGKKITTSTLLGKMLLLHSTKQGPTRLTATAICTHFPMSAANDGFRVQHELGTNCPPNVVHSGKTCRATPHSSSSSSTTCTPTSSSLSQINYYIMIIDTQTFSDKKKERKKIEIQ